MGMGIQLSQHDLGHAREPLGQVELRRPPDRLQIQCRLRHRRHFPVLLQRPRRLLHHGRHGKRGRRLAFTDPLAQPFAIPIAKSFPLALAEPFSFSESIAFAEPFALSFAEPVAFTLTLPFAQPVAFTVSISHAAAAARFQGPGPDRARANRERADRA